MVETTKHLV